jgi:hypothetical protein
MRGQIKQKIPDTYRVEPWQLYALAVVSVIWVLVSVPSSRDYFAEIIHHWVASMSSVVSLAIAFYEDRVKGKIDSRVFYLVAVLLFMFATFQAWQDQHQREISAATDVTKLNEKMASLTIPQLTTRMDGVSIGQVTKQQEKPTVITFFASVDNVGAPTILDQWRAVLKLKDGTEIPGQPTFLPKEKTVLSYGPSNKYGLELRVMDNIAVRSKPNPIVSGGGVSGWIAFVFQVRMSAVFGGLATLSFEDVHGKVYSIEHKLENRKDFPPSYRPWKAR